MHDLILQGGTVYDGLGNPATSADVAIDGDEVAGVGRDLGPSRRVIDADGLAVAPGFIDPHSHSDSVPLLDGPQPFKLLQGVTTEVVGNCGFSLAPLSEEAARYATSMYEPVTGGVELEAGSFGELLDRIEAGGPSNNMAVLVGHNTLRLSANGMERDLRPGALDAMARDASEAFAAGAVGLSSGLIYTPGTYADIDELIELAKVAHRWGGLYSTHMRDEGDALGEALDEAIEIGRRARISVQISHCKAAGRHNHGKSGMLLAKLRAARIEGIDIRGDQYPYLAGSTFLAALLPTEALEGGVEALRGRLENESERSRLRKVAEGPDAGMGAGLWRQAEPADVLVVSHRQRRTVGRTLAEIAGRQDAWDTLSTLLVEDPSSAMVITLMDEADVRRIMADPLIAIGSDNGAPTIFGHPRTWGCFPRLLGRYVRELEHVSWAEAIRKMTSSAAEQFGLRRRGWLGPGASADLCVFDPATVGHDGTYLDPMVAPTGIRCVVLGGEVVVDDGMFAGGRHGRVLRAGRAERR